MQCCHIIPNKVFIQLAKKEKNPVRRKEILNTIQENIRQRYKRSVIFNNRKLFLSAVRMLTGMERRWYYDCNNTWSFPSEPALKFEESHAQDKPEPRQIIPQEHVYNMDATYDFYRDLYKRKSFDKKSGTVKFFSKYGSNYDNAYWDGESMVFGAGGDYFNDFGGSLNVVGHEFSHAVDQYDSNLIYEAQSGALSESFADVMACCLEQYVNNESVDQAHWLIGNGIWKTSVVGPKYKALRSMAKPGTAYPGDDQPDHMNNYYKGSDDNFGVHINSGIPNKAFYNFAMELGGDSWERAGKIWYKTVGDQRLVKSNCTFQQFAKATVTIAKRIDSNTVNSLKESWRLVGISI
jgi:Zn-dependent metalloprotease